MSDDAFGHWNEWKEKCARNLCSDEAALYLRDFIFPRFLKHIQTAGQGKYQTPDSGQIPKDDAWHLFETHFQVNETREGKSYKDWLFDRIRTGGQPLQTIEGGATLLLRSAVREFLRREFALTVMDAIDRPLSGSDGSSLTLHDLLPGSIDPADEAALNEYAELGRENAAEFELTMTGIEKICAMAKCMNISLADERVTALAGKGRSVLFDTYNKMLQRLADSTHRKFQGEDRECIEILTGSTLKALHEILFSKKNPENAYSQLFSTEKAGV